MLRIKMMKETLKGIISKLETMKRPDILLTFEDKDLRNGFMTISMKNGRMLN